MEEGRGETNDRIQSKRAEVGAERLGASLIIEKVFCVAQSLTLALPFSVRQLSTSKGERVRKFGELAKSGMIYDQIR